MITHWGNVNDIVWKILKKWNNRNMYNISTLATFDEIQQTSVNGFARQARKRKRKSTRAVCRDRQGSPGLFRGRKLRSVIAPVPFAAPGGSVHGERVNFTRLVLGCIEAKLCEQILIWSSRRDLYKCQYTPLHSSLISMFAKMLPNAC